MFRGPSTGVSQVSGNKRKSSSSTSAAATMSLQKASSTTDYDKLIGISGLNFIIRILKENGGGEFEISNNNFRCSF